jgi:septum formation protein
MIRSVTTTIYLASHSPRRRELLRQIGVTIDVLLLRADPKRGIDVDEKPLSNETAEAHVMRVARAKAAAGWRNVLRRHLPPRPLLAADTIVVLDGEIIGKPKSLLEAKRVLQRLSGRRHQVFTAVAAIHEEHTESVLSCSSVEFRELDTHEIERYAATREPLDKAGAYGLQGRAAVFVRAITGSPSGIVGLPLFETALLLREFGIVAV